MWLAEHFWQYSVEVYSQAAAQRACLYLQDEAGLNVNLLLMCGFLTNQGAKLSSEQFNALCRAVKPAADQTQLHRQRRKKAKKDSSGDYAQLLQQELVLERQQQQCMIDWLNKQEIKPATEQSKRLNAQTNLTNYVQSAKRQWSTDISQALNVLATLFDPKIQQQQ